MRNTKFLVKTDSKNYPIYLGNNLLNNFERIFSQNLNNVNKIAILVDHNSPSAIFKNLKRSLKKFNITIFKLKGGEKIKNIKIANKLVESLLKKNFSRTDCIIAFGGGVIGDLSAFVSSITKRGIKFINIPTTLLAQVDASIGGKTAVNSAQGKNLIGSFYQPDFVVIDVATLKNLPQREIICGYGEILKHSLIYDKNFFFWLLKYGKKIIYEKNNFFIKAAILKSCRIKAKIVNLDEKEKNLRMILNFGHTFAHGFEGANNFSNNLKHGEAVLLGMMMASHLSYKKKILSVNDLLLIRKHYLDLKLPMKVGNYLKKSKVKKIVNFIKKDKKNTNDKINLILLKKIGKTTKPKNVYINVKELEKFLKLQFVL